MRFWWTTGMLVLLISCGKKASHKDIEWTNLNESNFTSKLSIKERFCQEASRQFNPQGKFAQLSFVNFGYRGIGRCRGHSLVNQKMNKLALFEPDISCLTSECVTLNLDAIDKIMNYEVAHIRGYKNLLELSSVEIYAKYLKSYVISISHRYSALDSELRFEGETQDERVFLELSQRIKEGHLPYIGLRGDNNLGSHGVLGIGLKKRGSKTVICIRDPNFVLKTEQDVCTYYVYLDAQKRAMYARGDSGVSRLFNFSLTSDEDNRERYYFDAKMAYCRP